MIRALATSHALGSTNISLPECRTRKAAALACCCTIAQTHRVKHNSRFYAAGMRTWIITAVTSSLSSGGFLELSNAHDGATNCALADLLDIVARRHARGVETAVE